ncbi:MAG: hypothetical protein SF053_11730, partial [Bacteroidia bacterium]|nr:hypothetical protein [Bacteroidia bacterium]
MKNFRYPGLRTFDASEGDRFYGREEDTSQILKKIQLHNTIVLLGKSGLGKSSILTTRIIPILNGEFQYTDIPEDLTKKIAIPVRLHTYTPERHIYPLGILDQILTEWDNAPTFLNDIEPGDPGFWEHCKNILLLNPGKTGIVLVFDQFEELFTYPKEGIEFFAEVIADLLNHRMPAGFRQCLMRQLRNAPDSLSEEQLQVIYDDTDVRIIFAIREDRLSDLNQLAGRIPDIQRYFYNLTPLSRPQATEAIVKPAVLESPQLLSAPFIYTPSALDRILTYLSKDNTQPIETFQLQLICQYIEQELIIKQKKIQIEANDLHNLDSIFKVYYDRILNQIPTPKIRRAVQNLIEERLILDGENRRLSLYEGQIVQQLKVPAETLIYLVNQRLLRAEPDNRGGYLYELSHDVMIAPIAEFRDKRRASEVWKKRALTVASIASLLTIM